MYRYRNSAQLLVQKRIDYRYQYQNTHNSNHHPQYNKSNNNGHKKKLNETVYTETIVIYKIYCAYIKDTTNIDITMKPITDAQIAINTQTHKVNYNQSKRYVYFIYFYHSIKQNKHKNKLYIQAMKFVLVRTKVPHGTVCNIVNYPP